MLTARPDLWRNGPCLELVSYAVLRKFCRTNALDSYAKLPTNQLYKAEYNREMIQRHGPGVLLFIAKHNFRLNSWMRGRELDNMQHTAAKRGIMKFAHKVKETGSELAGVAFRHAAPLELIMAASSTTVILVQNDVYLGKLLANQHDTDYVNLQTRWSCFVDFLLDTGNEAEVHLVHGGACFKVTEDARNVRLDGTSPGWKLIINRIPYNGCARNVKSTITAFRSCSRWTPLNTISSLKRRESISSGIAPATAAACMVTSKTALQQASVPILPNS
jgi:hypothetical protein